MMTSVVNGYDPPPARKMPRGAGAGSATTSAPRDPAAVAAAAGRLLDRLEVHERRLVVERRLQQIHLRLEQVALRLRDEERRRQPDLVAALLGVEPLLRERRAGARGVHALGRAVNLPAGLADRSRPPGRAGSRSAAPPAGARPRARARLAAS